MEIDYLAIDRDWDEGKLLEKNGRDNTQICLFRLYCRYRARCVVVTGGIRQVDAMTSETNDNRANWY